MGDPTETSGARAVPEAAEGRSASIAALAAALALAVSAVAIHANDPDPAPVPAIPAGTVPLADIIERVQPAVVNISVLRGSGIETPVAGRYRGPDPRAFEGTPFEDMLRHFFETPPDGRAGRRREAQAFGSGFVIDPAGYVVTNNHVVEGAGEIKVTLNDGTEYAATVKGRDPATDLALLEVEADRPLPAVSFGDSSRVRVGEWVVAVGNPFGLGGSATAGIVSARGRDIRSGPFDDYLQIDAPINMGNSGGPVFDMRGEVIGINTAIFSPNGGSVGIGFAIPASLAQPVVAELRAAGEVRRGWLGVEVQDLDPGAAQSLGLEDARGALVARVVPDSPAAKAGVRPGDVIVSFGGQAVGRIKDLTRLVAATGEDEVRIEVWRGGKLTGLAARITRRDSASAQLAFAPGPQEEAQGGASAGRLGLALAPLTDEARARLRLDAQARGAVVVGVTPDSPAAAQDLRPGDIIEMIGQQAVSGPQEVADAVAEAAGRERKAVLLLVRRGDDRRFVTVSLS
jgi:serine protease Do